MARGHRNTGAVVPAPATQTTSSGAGASTSDASARLDRFMDWGARFIAWDEFELNGRQEAELNASWVMAARHALAAPDRRQPPEWQAWMAEVYTALRRRKQPPSEFADLIVGAVNENSELHFGAKRSLAAWLKQNPAETERRLQDLWGPGDLRSRIQGFLDELPREVASGLGARLGFVSLLLSGEDPEGFPFFQTTLAKTGYRLTGYPPPPDGADELTHYAHYARFLRHLRDEAQRRGLPVRDSLDAYALLNWVGRGPTWFKKNWGPPGWDPADVEALSSYVADTPAA